MVFWTCWAYVLSFLARWAYVLSSKFYVPSSWAGWAYVLSSWMSWAGVPSSWAWWTPTCWTPGRGELLRAGLLGVVDSYMLNKIWLVSLPVIIMGIPIPVGEKSSSHTIPLFKHKEKGQKEKVVYLQFENKFFTYCCKFTKHKNKIYEIKFTEFYMLFYFFIPFYFFLLYVIIFSFHQTLFYVQQ